MLRGFSFCQKSCVFGQELKCELWDFQMFMYIYNIHLYIDDFHMF